VHRWLRSGTAAVSVGIALAAPMASCRAPTEIEVVVTTDFDCADLKDVTVTVGTLGDALESAPPTSTSTSCSAGSVGTIVVVPSGSDHAEIGIKVVGGFGVKQAEACAPAPGSSPPDYGVGCIVARRALDFTPHTPLTVPVVLRADCNGITCRETQTCVQGLCVAASLASPSACSSPAGCGECDLVDGGCAAVEAGVPPVTFTDCGDMSGLQVGAAWPMNNGCPTLLSRSPFVVQASPMQKWSFSTRGNKEIISSPVIGSDGTVYFGSDDGYAYALAPDTGAKKWEWAEPTGSPIQGDFAIGADGTIVGTSRDSTFGLASTDGALAWRVPNTSGGADVTVTGGELALVGVGFSLLALEVTNAGTQAWAAQTGGAVVASPAVAPDGTIYVASGDGNVYAVGATTHAIAWKYPLGAPGSVAYFGGTVIAAAPGAGLAAIDAASGIARWTQPTATGNGIGPVASDGTVYVQFGSTLKAFDAAGDLRWSVDTGATLGISMLVDGAGSIVVVTGGQLAAYEPQQGHQLWAVPATFNGLLAIGADGTVYEATGDGHLLAFGN